MNQARTYLTEGALNRVLLLSDGLAKQGVANPRELAGQVQELRGEHLLVSTGGVGEESDEGLLPELLRGGRLANGTAERTRGTQRRDGDFYRAAAVFAGGERQTAGEPCKRRSS